MARLDGSVPAFRMRPKLFAALVWTANQRSMNVQVESSTNSLSMQTGRREQTKGIGLAVEQSRIRAAMQLAKAGNTESAREAFEAICTDNNDCEAGWFWLASLVEDAETGLDCLREVLRINP